MKSKSYSLIFIFIIIFSVDTYCQKNTLDVSATSYTNIVLSGDNGQDIDNEIINDMEFLSEYESMEIFEMLDNYEVIVETDTTR